MRRVFYFGKVYLVSAVFLNLSYGECFSCHNVYHFVLLIYRSIRSWKWSVGVRKMCSFRSHAFTTVHSNYLANKVYSILSSTSILHTKRIKTSFLSSKDLNDRIRFVTSLDTVR